MVVDLGVGSSTTARGERVRVRRLSLKHPAAFYIQRVLFFFLHALLASLSMHACMHALKLYLWQVTFFSPRESSPDAVQPDRSACRSVRCAETPSSRVVSWVGGRAIAYTNERRFLVKGKQKSKQNQLLRGPPYPAWWHGLASRVGDPIRTGPDGSHSQRTSAQAKRSLEAVAHHVLRHALGRHTWRRTCRARRGPLPPADIPPCRLSLHVDAQQTPAPPVCHARHVGFVRPVSCTSPHRRLLWLVASLRLHWLDAMSARCLLEEYRT